MERIRCVPIFLMRGHLSNADEGSESRSKANSGSLRWVVESGKMAGPVCIVLLSLLLEGCTRPPVHEPITLTLLDGVYGRVVRQRVRAGVSAIH